MSKTQPGLLWLRDHLLILILMTILIRQEQQEQQQQHHHHQVLVGLIQNKCRHAS